MEGISVKGCISRVPQVWLYMYLHPSAVRAFGKVVGGVELKSQGRWRGLASKSCHSTKHTVISILVLALPHYMYPYPYVCVSLYFGISYMYSPRETSIVKGLLQGEGTHTHDTMTTTHCSWDIDIWSCSKSMITAGKLFIEKYKIQHLQVCNRWFPSCLLPLFQSESLCRALHMDISFIHK